MNESFALVKLSVLSTLLLIASVATGSPTNTMEIQLYAPVDIEDPYDPGTSVPRVRPEPRHRAPSFRVPSARPLGLTLAEDPVALAFRAVAPRPTSLAAADFDGDGISDLVCGYASPDGGFVTLHRGNSGSMFPRDPKAAMEPPFLSPGRVFAIAQVPDYLHAGDFDGDGRSDIVAAARGSDSLYLLSGDGHGELALARRVALRGRVTTLVAGEINRADGLTDLVVGMSAPDGPAIVVFEGPEGALAREGELIPLPALPTTLALARLDDEGSIDLAVGAGSDVWLLAGRDRRLSLDAARQRLAGPPRLERLASFETPVRAIAAGDFVWDPVNRPEIAVLSDDGSIEVVGWSGTPSWRKLGKRSLNDDASGISARASLLTARVSGLLLEEVVVADPTAQSLHVFLGEVRASSDLTDLGEPLAAEIEREPLALLPMRLNVDAQHDLVVLFRDDPDPWIVMSSFASTFTVTTVSDTGGGSLRTAISDANASPGADLIDFAIGVAGVPVIWPSSPLPAIVEAVTIDAYTQYEAVPNTAPLAEGSNAVLKVVVDGVAAGSGANGLELLGAASVVRGLVVQNFDNNGILITSGGNFIEGNFIGIDHEGTVGRGNHNGVRIEGAINNTVGGAAAAARNLIGGNFDDGVDARDPGADGNLIQGNLIGVDRLGTAGIPNHSDGVQMSYAIGGTVGGTAPGAGNIISANLGDGVDIRFGSAVSVQGNVIGLTADGVDAMGNGDEGVRIASTGVTVGGTTNAARNVISSSGSGGVSITNLDSTLNLVQGNFIGTDSGGTIDRGNTFVGVIIENAPENTVGGITPGAGNVICCSSLAGVSLQFADATDNQVQGNLIGTDHTGTSALSNDGEGIRIINAPNNEIGGTSPGAGNVISGNAASGMLIYGQTASGNQVLGNLIGTDITGTVDLGNGESGVYVFDATNNTIGDPVNGNLISGNERDGVRFERETATLNRLIGNRIGTNLFGAASLGNTLAGVRLMSSSDNDIGGTGIGEGNVIAVNRAQGVVIEDVAPPGTGNRILGNSVFSNSLLGIDLGNDGVSPNDAGDLDVGTNELQNFPTLASATLDDTNNVTIAGTLNARPDEDYGVELFSSYLCDSTGHGEGRFFLGSTVVTTNGAGNAAFNVTLANPALNANRITATTTDANGNTSEFSMCETAVCGGYAAVFPSKMVATDKNTLSWGDPFDIRYAKGHLHNVSSYSTYGSGQLLAASALDTSGDNPLQGEGVYFLVRTAICSSWQTTPGAEPARDAALP